MQPALWAHPQCWCGWQRNQVWHAWSKKFYLHMYAIGSRHAMKMVILDHTAWAAGTSNANSLAPLAHKSRQKTKNKVKTITTTQYSITHTTKELFTAIRYNRVLDFLRLLMQSKKGKNLHSIGFRSFPALLLTLSGCRGLEKTQIKKNGVNRF